MKVARFVLVGGLGLIAIGCARERGAEVETDTTAMAPAPSPIDRTAVFEVRELTPGLLVEATFRPADAQRVVFSRYPNATILEATIERRGTDLVYLYRVRDDNSGQTYSVWVNANTGLVIDTLPR